MPLKQYTRINTSPLRGGVNTRIEKPLLEFSGFSEAQNIRP